MKKRIRLRKHLPPKLTRPTDMQLTKPGETDSDRMGFTDLNKVFDNYDEGNTKPGMPYVDVYGSSLAKCPYCKVEMVLLENGNLKCSQCRRQLAVDAPQEQMHNDNTPMMGTNTGMDNSPTPAGANFDMQQYPTKVPGDLF